MTVEKLPISKRPPHPGRMAALGAGGKVTPLGYRLIGSRFQIEAELWTVTARPELNFVYLENERGECMLLPIAQLVGLKGIAPPSPQEIEPR
jgi:hypothetical protein